MNPYLVSLIIFICLFGGGLLGMRLRAVLPQSHLSDDSKHLLDTGLGIIGTIGGLVLGLLVGSAFGSYNAQRNNVVQMAANIVLLDRVLAHYGPDAKEVRVVLRGSAVHIQNEIWPPRGQQTHGDPLSARGEVVYDKLEDLPAVTDEQKSLKGTAVGLAVSIGQMRWLIYSQLASGVSPPLIAVLAFWFTITFIGLGINARPNSTVVAALFLAAIAVSGAVFLLQEMYSPFQGPMQISSGPFQAAQAVLGK